ncbi:MAG: hypothetical protein WDN06_17985 [Asticcacaulis sp.]
MTGCSAASGSDTFVFSANSGADIIKDFSTSDNDHIDVSAGPTAPPMPRSSTPQAATPSSTSAAAIPSS